MDKADKKWLFQKSPHRTPLTGQEVRYWKAQLSKILKIGQEYEMNLPDNKNGSCNGDNGICPCVRLTKDNDCWKQCIGCDIPKMPETCKNRAGNCDGDECSKCEHYEMECNGVHCPSFVSFCAICQDFQRNCKSCSYWNDPENSPAAIRRDLIARLKPNNTYGQVNESGVHSVITDGSLTGGVGKEKGAEIITIGRRIDYWEFHKMAKGIIDQAISRGAFVDARCSLHMHVLSSHHRQDLRQPLVINEMEKPLPEIVMANFHQLCRKYQNPITWLTSGLSNEDNLTRWEKFRISILDVNVQQTMSDVSAAVSAKCYKPKYGFVNYNNTQFDENGNVACFHVEMRAADCLLSPSAAAALACLYYAMVIKAVELSRFGVLVIDDKDWFQQAMTIKKALMNNNGDWDDDRHSNTSRLKPYYRVLTEQSLALVHQCKNILIKIGPAFEVLEKLAVEPCSLRRCKGKTWQQIEEDLAVKLTEEDKLDICLNEILALVQISDCKNIEAWAKATAEYISKQNGDDDPLLLDDISNFVKQGTDRGEMVWSSHIGAPLLV